MKKKVKALLSIVLALTMLLSVTAPVFAATSGEKQYKQFKKMTVFGDSVMSGYGEVNGNPFKQSAGTYTSIVADAVSGGQYTPFCHGGSTVHSVSKMFGIPINNFDQEGQDYFYKNNLSDYTINQYETLCRGGEIGFGTIEQNVADSDLIMIALGLNDIGYFPMWKTGLYIEQLKEDGELTVDEYPLVAAKFLKESLIGYENFAEGYPKIIERIKEINPDATLVFINYYNADAKVKVFEESEYGIGRGLDGLFASMNTLLKFWAEKYDAIYADVSGAWQFLDNCDIPTLVNADYEQHPGIEGHKWMAEQILKAMPAVERKLCLPQNGEVRFEQNGVDLGKFELEFKGFGWTVKDTETGLYVGINGESDKPATWFYDGGFFTIGTVKKDSRFGFSYLTFVKRYLTADESGALAVAGSRSKMTMFVET